MTVAAIDPTALARFMDGAGLVGTGDQPEVTRLTGGSQNELFAVTRGGVRTVLRMPPPGADATRQDGLRRELTLLRALADTDVPHARLVVGCDEPDVLGRPFYLMRHVDGWSPTSSAGWAEPYRSAPELRGPLGFGLVDGAARLARVDWRGRGLQEFGRPDGFHDRQVDRWTRFLGRFAFRDLPGLDEATQWLGTHRPRRWEPGIMHGDYQFANIMFSNDEPALSAVIDWEMATIGDPLLDLGWALIAWDPEGDDMVKARYLDLEGMPPRDDLLQYYETVSGRSTEDIDYYVVLARWKLGIVLEMSYARFASGQSTNPMLESFGAISLELLRKAAELSRTA